LARLPFRARAWSQQARGKVSVSLWGRVPYKAELNEHDRNYADVA
jgi:hypothetical protein